MLISLSLFLPPMSGLPLFGDCTRLEMSPLYACRRAAETLVPEVCFRHLRWIGERSSSSSLVRVRVLRGATRVALHPSGCSTQPGGCELRSATSTTFAGTFPAQRTTPRGMLSALLSVTVIRLDRSWATRTLDRKIMVFCCEPQ